MTENTQLLLDRIGCALVAAGTALRGTVVIPTETVSTEMPPAAVEEKPKPKTTRKRKSRAKVTKKTETATHVEAETPKDDFEATAEPEVETKIDSDMLKKQLVAFAKAKGKAKAFAVLEKYGASKVADLKESDYGKVYAEVNV